MVFDKVDSSNAKFEKKWLLHGLEEPEINGNQTIFRRTYADETANQAYNGKMTVDTLLPAKDNLTINKVGGEGKEYLVDGTNYYGYELADETDEGETWRIEVSPKQESKSDLFLNVMQVSDNDKDYYLETKLIDTDMLAGVQIADRVVTFAKSGKEIADSFTLTTTGEGTLQYTLADVKSGTWTVKGDGFEQDVVAAQEGKLLSFTAPAGSYTLTYKDANAIRRLLTRRSRNWKAFMFESTSGFYIPTLRLRLSMIVRSCRCAPFLRRSAHRWNGTAKRQQQRRR